MIRQAIFDDINGAAFEIGKDTGNSFARGQVNRGRTGGGVTTAAAAGISAGQVGQIPAVNRALLNRVSARTEIGKGLVVG